MFKLGGLLGMFAVSLVWYFADWGFYMAVPMPKDTEAAFGAALHTMETMPNPVYFIFMELGGALVLALACLQIPLTIAQAAKNGAIAVFGMLLLVNVSWYMWFNVPWHVESILIEAIYRCVMGAIGGALIVTVANKFNK